MIRVLLGIALVVFLASFIDFAGDVIYLIYLGIKEFFKTHSPSKRKAKS